jgi:peptidoglycan/LPS O-acetylase OafA/YrhL
MGALPAALLAWSLRTAPGVWPVVLAGLAGLIAAVPDLQSGGLVVLAGLLVVDRLQGWISKAPTAWGQAMADLSWPVYLVHPAVLVAGERLLGMEEPISRLVFGLCGSAAAGLVILRVPVLKRWLLLRSRT